MKAKRIIGVFALLVSVVTIDLPKVFAEMQFQVIVNPENDVTSIDKQLLADIYLKKVSLWPNGEPIHPVDLKFESKVRHNFSKTILNRPTSAVRIYWQQLIFSGRGLPPPELKDELKIINFVFLNRDAIGYVSNGADIGDLKVVEIR